VTAVGVVMGQGQGSDTSALLAAAGEAVTRLVASVAQAGGISTDAGSNRRYRRLLLSAPDPPSAQP
jgi:hypothetical protein